MLHETVDVRIVFLMNPFVTGVTVKTDLAVQLYRHVAAVSTNHARALIFDSLAIAGLAIAPGISVTLTAQYNILLSLLSSLLYA
jgi:hypothetical protein